MAKRSQKKKAVPRHVLPPAPGSKALFSGAWVPLLLAMVAFAAYWPSLQSGFVYDARKEILEEGFITSLSNLPAVLSLKVLGMDIFLGQRPGQLLYLMLNAAVWGKEPFGYHLSSNLLHAANVALLFVLLRRLIASEITGLARSGVLKARLAAAVATLIFALHPIAVESVAEVSYSSSLLVTFFTLLALLAATAFRPDHAGAAWLTGLMGTFCAFAAVASKESGIAAALLLIVYWFLFRRGEAKGPWFLFLGAAAVVTAAFLAARFGLAPPDQVHAKYLGGSFSRVFLIQPRLWVFMMGKLLWPARLSANYTMENINGIPTPVALAVLGVAVLSQVWLACQSRMGALGVAIYWLGLATVSNFVPLYCPVADRFYSLPLAGWAMQLLALLIMLLHARRGFWLALAPCLGALLPLLILTLAREDVFSDECSLWSDTIQASPFSFTAHHNLGLALVQKGRGDEAIAQYQKAMEINPNDAQIHNNLGVALAKKGQVDEAMVQFRMTQKIDPDDAKAHNNLGNILFKKGQVDEAMAEYQKALEIVPNDADAHNNLGLVLAQKGRVDEAISECQEALKINPNYADAHTNLGNSFLKKGQLDMAIGQFQKALEITPNDAQAHYNLGVILAQRGSVDEALAQYQKALEIDPNNASVRNNLGNALFQKGQPDEAMTQYRKTLEINPNDAGAHNNLGWVLLKKGQVDEAMTQFEKALEINPPSADAQSNLGMALFQKGQVDKAIIQFQKALEINPSMAEAHYNLGLALAQKGRVAAAMAEFQEAIRLKPDYSEAQNNLAKLKAMARPKAAQK